jgi:hypothetical protein
MQTAAQSSLATGQHWLHGLLDQASLLSAFLTPTVSRYVLYCIIAINLIEVTMSASTPLALKIFS